MDLFMTLLVGVVVGMSVVRICWRKPNEPLVQRAERRGRRDRKGMR